MRLGTSSSNLLFRQVLSAKQINFSSSQQRSLPFIFSYFHDIVHPHYIVGMRGFGRVFITFSQLAPDEGVVVVALVVGVLQLVLVGEPVDHRPQDPLVRHKWTQGHEVFQLAP